jgi:dTDP-4-dehydrorhamnose 3,5-epimerase-like enzyme
MGFPVKIVDCPSHGDARGELYAWETSRDIPFEIKRVYYMLNTRIGVSRGFHAHYDLKQLVVCLKGRCQFTLDDGNTRKDIFLDSPNKGLLIDNLMWREIHNISQDCIILCFADDIYKESDYIRDYTTFLEVAQNAGCRRKK